MLQQCDPRHRGYTLQTLYRHFIENQLHFIENQLHFIGIFVTLYRGACYTLQLVLHFIASSCLFSKATRNNLQSFESILLQAFVLVVMTLQRNPYFQVHVMELYKFITSRKKSDRPLFCAPPPSPPRKEPILIPTQRRTYFGTPTPCTP